MTRRARLTTARAADEERAYVEAQLRDFGTADWTEDDAIAELAFRFGDLFEREYTAARAPDVAADIRGASPEVWLRRVLGYHERLYAGMLNCAGAFPRVDDPWKGDVVFGGTSARTLGEKFQGLAPDQIEPALLAAFRLLGDPAGDPVRAVARTYQRFVFVHPFYDANGRIGRILVSRYLAAHNLWLDWEALSAESASFYRTLNKVHGHWARSSERYVGVLVSFVRRFVSPMPPDEDTPFDGSPDA